MPARPVQKRCWVKAKTYKSKELAALKAYQSAHSQDSGMGMSEEMSAYGLEPIITVHKPGKCRYMRPSDVSLAEFLFSGTSASLTRFSKSFSQRSTLHYAKRKLRKTGLKRARSISESSISEFEVKKPKLLPKLDNTPLEGTELVPCTSPSISTPLASEKLQLELPSDSQKESIVSSEPEKLTERSQSGLTDESEIELCIFCNSAPKDSIFVHGKMAHHCSCYPCAKKTLSSIGRCPLCNAGVEKVLRMF